MTRAIQEWALRYASVGRSAPTLSALPYCKRDYQFVAELCRRRQNVIRKITLPDCFVANTKHQAHCPVASDYLIFEW
jgi:hypothetical protein